jgi:voltage-gated potassium channel
MARRHLDPPTATGVDAWIARRFSGSIVRPRQAAYLIVVFWLVAIIAFGIAERLLDPKTFPTVWLAFWWALQTVTTVGYGDVVPQEVAGKALATILMLGGLSLLSIVTATIASGFVTSRQAQLRESGKDPIMRQLDELASGLARVETRLDGTPFEVYAEEPAALARFYRSLFGWDSESAPDTECFRYAVVADPEGAILAVWERDPRPGPDE